jgi:hypothetical protein
MRSSPRRGSSGATAAANGRLAIYAALEAKSPVKRWRDGDRDGLAVALAVGVFAPGATHVQRRFCVL